MATTNVDGLVSGLETTSLIASLMALEKQPQDRLKAKLASVNTTISTYQTLNSRVATLRDAVTGLSTATGWQAMKATASSTSVSVSATGTAVPGSLSFTVDRLASAHSLVSATGVASTSVVVAAPNSTISIAKGGGTAVDINVGTGTLADVVTAINAANAGVTASAMQVSPGNYRLQIASVTTGSAGELTVDGTALTGVLGALGTLSSATDAKLTVGSGPNAIEVTSSTNTFADLMAGVTLTVNKADPATTITMTVAPDSGTLADKVSKIVDGINGVFSYIKLQGAYNVETRTGGPLLGDPIARQLEAQLYRELQATGTDLKGVGLTLTKEGFLSFDKAAFTAAYEANPAAVIAVFSENGAGKLDDGLAKRLETAGKAATDTVSGLLTNAIAGRKTEVTRLNHSITDWDARLEKKELTLRRTFTALETALNNLKNQSSWLAGQLAGLGGSSS